MSEKLLSMPFLIPSRGDSGQKDKLNLVKSQLTLAPNDICCSALLLPSAIAGVDF